MLALAHGSKGIMSWAFPTRHYTSVTRCGGNFYERGLLDGNDPSSNPTPLGYYWKDFVIPRLKGNFGTTLLKLDYTGDYINVRY